MLREYDKFHEMRKPNQLEESRRQMCLSTILGMSDWNHLVAAFGVGQYEMSATSGEASEIVC